MKGNGQEKSTPILKRVLNSFEIANVALNKHFYRTEECLLPSRSYKLAMEVQWPLDQFLDQVCQSTSAFGNNVELLFFSDQSTLTRVCQHLKKCAKRWAVGGAHSQLRGRSLDTEVENRTWLKNRGGNLFLLFFKKGHVDFVSISWLLIFIPEFFL